jgi:hypothetical protein
MGALKGIDTKSLQAAAAGKDAKSLLAKLPANMAGMVPKDLDLTKIDTKALMANPSAFAGKLPPGINLAALMG